MRLRDGSFGERGDEVGVAELELRDQVIAFEAELAVGDGDPSDLLAGFADAGAVEPVSADVGLVGEAMEEAGDRGQWLVVLTEPLELRVAGVAAGAAGQHRLCEEPFAPARDQTGAIEVAGVKGPQAHGVRVGELAAGTSTRAGAVIAARPGHRPGMTIGMSSVGARAWVAALAMTVALAACGSSGDQRVGELVDSWSQADSESWVEDAMPIETVLLTTDAELDQWIDAMGGDDDLNSLREVDLSGHILVIGGYPRCMEYSLVLLEEDGALRFVVTRDSEDEHTACAWSPYTIDAWSVPLEVTGGEVPDLRREP